MSEKISLDSSEIIVCFFIESCGYLPIFEPQFLQDYDKTYTILAQLMKK